MSLDNKDIIRVVLDGESKTAFDKMTETLKTENQHIKLTRSRFVACLVKRYSALYFEQDKAQIANEFFDSKEHLKDAIKGARSPEDLEKALSIALERLKSGQAKEQYLGKKRGRKPKVDVNLPDKNQTNLIE